MPSNIDADLQEYLNNFYYGHESLSELTDAQLSKIADEYNEWSRGHIARLSKMQDAERLMHTTGAIDGSIEDIKERIKQIRVQSGNEKTAHRWEELLTNIRAEVLQAKHSQIAEAMKSKGQNTIEDPNSVKIIDKSYLNDTFVPPSPQVQHLIVDNIKKFTLNKEQSKAFRIIANHASKTSGEQLKMYLGGMAGTGKSQVIKALIQFFNERNEGHRFMCMAPTGAAAALIGGSTYRHILGFTPFDGSEPSSSHASATAAIDNLHGIGYIFLDEVSMVSNNEFYRICEQMCIARNKPDEPFGGINIIVAGDFAQLAPVTGNSLYTGGIAFTIHHTNSVYDQKGIIGQALWHQFTTVVILK